MSNMTDLWLSGVFFQAVHTAKFVFAGDPPGPTEGAYYAPLDLVVGWKGGEEGDTPPLTVPPSTPSASRSRRLRHLDCQAPKHKFLATSMTRNFANHD